MIRITASSLCVCVEITVQLPPCSAAESEVIQIVRQQSPEVQCQKTKQQLEVHYNALNMVIAGVGGHS